MIEQYIDTWLEKKKTALIQNYDKLGLRASGQWAKSLESFSKLENGIYKIGMLGESYTEQLENGRRPNQKQSKDKLKAWVGWAGSTFLKDWVNKKGLSINPFAVAWKIAREGWQVPNRFNAGGLVSNVINKTAIQEIQKEITNSKIIDFKSDIRKILK